MFNVIVSLTNVYTGLHIAAAGLKLGGFGKIIISQPSAWQPVKLVLKAKRIRVKKSRKTVTLQSDID